MDYSRPELADRLAAEYVLGTLAGPARRRFDTLLPAHPALRTAVAQWQRRLAPLAPFPSQFQAAAVQPSPAVWLAVQERLFGLAPPQRALSIAPSSWWQRLALWQGLAGVSVAGVLGLSVLLQQQPPTQPPIVVVLASTSAAATGVASAAGPIPAHFVVSLNADGRSLVLKPINAPALETTKAMELWVVPAQGAPRSLGLVSPTLGATVLRTGLLAGTAAFAVSVEPPGGSPTGAPTGPIVSLGKLPV